MPSLLARLRFWLGLSALLIVVVVAGFYLYARHRVRQAVRNLPQKLGIEVQQSTEGFTISKSQAGRTLFSVTASRAVRYKEDGKAELHNVKIMSYGRDSDRADQISGADFEYDARTGDIAAQGKVLIQLQAAAPGTSQPGKNATEVGDPVELQTSGLTFNQKTGIAKTSETISFSLPQGTGSARGATYDAKNGTLELASDIHLKTSGPHETDLQARNAFFSQTSRELTLAGMSAESGVKSATAERLVLRLRDDNTVERADATVTSARIRGVHAAEFHAQVANVGFGAHNLLQNAVFSGGVGWQTSAPSATNGSAGRVSLAFAGNNEVRSAEFRDNVVISQAATAGEKSAQQSEFRGDGLDVVVRSGRFIQTANSVGAAQLIVTSAQTAAHNHVAQPLSPAMSSRQSPAEAPVPQGSDAQTVISAGRFDAKFGADNRISTLNGTAPVKIVSSSPGQPDRISTSRELAASFSGANQALQDAVQSGDVQIREGQRSATGDRADFNPAQDTLVLTGNVRFGDPILGATLTSNSLRLERKSGQVFASGDVKTSYSAQKNRQEGAMLASVEAIHVTAPQMMAQNATSVARYSGGARLWQGGNIVQAPSIEFNRNQRTLDARGEDGKRVSTVFVQPGQSAQKTPVEVSSSRLSYDDSQRKASFEGGVMVKSAGSTLQANRADVFLKTEKTAKSPTSPASAAPSEVQSIDAKGNVLLQQPGRHASGNQLVYTADEGKFVLTGTPEKPPSIFDAEHGQVTGVSLTFFNRDDRVLVDGSNSSTITQSTVKK